MVLLRGKCFINAEPPLSKVANFVKEQIEGAWTSAKLKRWTEPPKEIIFRPKVALKVLMRD